MVQRMGSLHFEEDFSEEVYGPLAKQSRLADCRLNQWSPQNHEFPIPPLLYNPLDEPSPLGLRLKKSPSLLELIETRLSLGTNASIVAGASENVNSGSNKDMKQIVASGAGANDKLKAANFPASILRIGSWEFMSRYESDLVAKCYYAKRKLVWEVLEGGLKSKIEIQWSDIMALKAVCPDDGPGTLTILLARQPVFFQEIDPQPRRHTIWKATSDFTDGQASINRQHCIQCPPGVLNKHYEKLIQCDMRLSLLSQQPEIVMESPYFDSQVSIPKNSEESKDDGCNHLPDAAKGSTYTVSKDAASAATAQSSSFKSGRTTLAAKHLFKEVSSPSSVMDAHTIEGGKIINEHDSEKQKGGDLLKVPGFRSSMSMSDFVSHIGNCISEQLTSGSLPSDKASECHGLPDNIAGVLLSDTQYAAGLDENSLMQKVDSLCCLLQDPAVASCAPVDGGKCDDDKAGNIMQASEGHIYDEPGCKQADAMPRKDSLADLLHHLPHIASLPKLLFSPENDDYQRI